MPDFQPTILVKKKDGSHVRMTMEEFREYQKNIKTSKQPVLTPDADSRTPQPSDRMTHDTDNLIQIKEAKKSEVLPMEVLVEAVATSAPVKDIFIDEAKYVRKYEQDAKLRTTKIDDIPKWTAKDHKSLLEEKNDELKQYPTFSTVPAKKEDMLSRILESIKFSIRDELKPRLQSLILSWLKDVRTNEQVVEYAIKPADKGGLGLTQTQAEELARAIAPKHLSTPALEHSSTEAPKHRSTEAPKFQEKQMTNSGYQAKNIERFKETQTGRPVMHDVLPPKEEKKSIGPIEELQMFSLQDFRRLSNKPQEAAKILKEKFEVLKQESYILYVKALKAWQDSPLYQQYQEVIREALSRRAKVAGVLVGGKDQLSGEEFTALAEAGKSLTS